MLTIRETFATEFPGGPFRVAADVTFPGAAARQRFLAGSTGPNR